MVKLTLITGEGRGKTSTALGHIYLERQKEKEILVAQFLKTGKNCGECKFLEKDNKIRWFCFGKEEFYHSEKQQEEYRDILNEGVEELKSELMKSKTDILLLDELGLALAYDLVKWEDLSVIINRVKEEVIITGRKIPEEIKDKADKIINIDEIKHPFSRGITARRGIDY